MGIVLWISSCTTPRPTPTANEREPIPGGGTRWTQDIDAQAKAFVSPPEKIPFVSRFLLGFAEREFDKELLPGRVLTWSTDLGIASGALEMYVEQGASDILDTRMLQLIRMRVSFSASSPFAIDVNSNNYREQSITEEEIKALQGFSSVRTVSSFSKRETAALEYAAAITKTPVAFDESLLSEVRALFTHEEIVAIACLSAKVNYWARFIEAMRIKPAGYTDDPALRLGDFETFAEAAIPAPQPGANP